MAGSRGRKALIHLLKSYIEQGQGEAHGYLLRGTMAQKHRCLTRARDLLVQVRTTEVAPREWKRSAQDTITRDLRVTASSPRVDCKARLHAIECLMLAAGYQVDVKDDATARLIKSQVTPAQPAPAQELNEVERALAKWNQRKMEEKV